ncbi:hypothetical protein GCM10007049_20750 [Echinicola pacifica]|uniref:Uncharacterized protein n=1 Tax=Echinicola pacifica TaxID=346377 RepID=A0A918PYN3_9BACT|nr:hypothetical protein [Echinicola pacifica]GGZ27749.1 hypothetical protein GCM10007049_20750 [Echinicola pacifica]
MKNLIPVTLLSLLLGCVLTLPTYGQKYLILQKGGNQKSRITYHEGDLIRYQPKDLNFFIDDQILEIKPDYLILRENIIRPENIAIVDVRYSDERNQTIKNLSTLTAAAGLLLFTAETINSIYQEGSLSYSTGGIVISSSLFVGSFVLSKLKRKYFKNEGRNKIQIIHLEFEN